LFAGQNLVEAFVLSLIILVFFFAGGRSVLMALELNDEVMFRERVYRLRLFPTRIMCCLRR
jgi:hypothetical protein